MSKQVGRESYTGTSQNVFGLGLGLGLGLGSETNSHFFSAVVESKGDANLQAD